MADPPSLAGVDRLLRPRIWLSAPTTPASVLVPPRSIPTTKGPAPCNDIRSRSNKWPAPSRSGPNRTLGTGAILTDYGFNGESGDRVFLGTPAHRGSHS